MTSLVVLIALCAPGQGKSDPALLPQPQVAQIRKLVQATKTHDVKIKSQLVERQQELIAAYAEFQLDKKRIEQLQEEVVDLQRQLLVNYHRFQMGLRQATGPNHFQTIKARVDRYVRLKESEKRSDASSPGTQEPDPQKAAR